MSVTITLKTRNNANQWESLDISNDVIINSLEAQKRADYSFEVGSFKMVSATLNYNIPPYSLCVITNGTQTDYYWISSECNLYLTTGKYVHDCTLLAPEAILECYVLGAKTFSGDYYSDFTDLECLKTLLEDNYTGISITFNYENQEVQNKIFFAENDYTFPDGTTFYLAIKTIANKNGYTFKLSISNATAYSYLVTICKQNTDEYDLNNSTILSFKMFQNTDNYCKYIQCASADVVDRDTKTTFKALTCRTSYGVVVTADNAQILLPTRVEGITKFVVNTDIRYSNMMLQSPIFDRSFVSEYFHNDGMVDVYGEYEVTVTKTLYEWRTNTYEKEYWQQLYDYWLKNLGLDNANFAVKYYIDGTYQGRTFAFICDEFSTATNYIIFYHRDLTNRMLEKNEFDALDVSKQPLYLVYESGSNVISNLNAGYKQDFWSTLVGTRVNGIFDTNFSYSDEIGSYSISYTWNFAGNCLDASFDVECVPIIDPLLIDTKNTNPDNEVSFKPMTRTYQMGESNGLPVDFTALTMDMDKQNETLGNIEAVLEIDSNTTYDNDGIYTIYIPKPNDKINFVINNVNHSFYISSVVNRYTTTKTIYQLNLAKTPYKIADAIGVDYQFNPVMIPLENILTRGLFFEITYNNFENLLNNNGIFLIRFGIDYGYESNRWWYLRPTIMKTQKNWILYAEFYDNAVIGQATNDATNTKKSIENVMPYGISYGVRYNAITFDLITMQLVYSTRALTIAESYKLPNFSGTFDGMTEITTERPIYKDSREKLAFTIKVNDSSI